MRYKRQEILFVDGYNMIGAWPELTQLKKMDQLNQARDQLLFELSEYRKYRDLKIIVVFDAQFVPGITQIYEHYQVEVVFTQEGETADSYIEREVAHWISPLNRVVVATSDMAEQWLIFQKGAMRMSANELYMQLQFNKRQVRQTVEDHYSQLIRRRSPWKLDQLKLLDDLRFRLDDDKNE
ncbi:NYN domain-containing protein [Facklamia sp. P12945]|uniref:YacP-like NYN domain-containing protein n=1 Tax=unclassified Facklamia TaxID=2622293 RepID=UPI003D16E515